MNPNLRSKRWHRQDRGQALPLIASMFLVLILFVGLGIDLGFAYVTRAAISKATDAAAMAGIRNLGQGQPKALAIAQSTFDANYNSSGVAGRQAQAPTVNLTFTQTANSNMQLTASASVPINTYFIRVLPTWKTVKVSASGQAQRARVIMSLVLDRSGSMTRNGGSDDLPPAVSSFIDHFDDTLDRTALISFASYSSPYDLAMGRPFKTQVKNYVNNVMNFAGGTGSPLGLSNGFTQVKAVPVAVGEDVVKVCVFFTDGMANLVQDTLNCGGTPTLRNFGGYDDQGGPVGFFDPTNGNELCQANGNSPSCCPGVNTFTSQIDGTQQKFKRKDVTAEAEFRSLQLAKAMRANGIIVYSIGLGDDDAINKDFLQQVANDPAAPGYVATDYDGEAVFAADSTQLKTAFDLIADKILYRLTQ